MSDSAAIGAAAAAIAGALTTIGAAVKGLADIKTTKDRVKVIEGDDGNGGLLAALRKRIEEVAGLIDSDLRADLEALAKVVKRYREEVRASSKEHPLARSGSYPGDPGALKVDDLDRRLETMERRVEAFEERSKRSEARLDKVEEYIGKARELLAEVRSDLRHLLGRG